MGTLLETDGISLSFGGLKALSDVSVHVREGSIVGLIGPNGAGKTTLFNVLSGLETPDVGTIRFDGHDITGLSAHRRAARGIGRSFQNLGLIMDETVEVNLTAAAYLSARYRSWDVFLRPRRWWVDETRINEDARQAAATFGLTDCWHERISDLSFGRSRIVELACVTVGRPRLTLLDEPTTGLDVAEVDQLLALLRAENANGTTILLVAHDVRFIMETCDHVYVLKQGAILFDGPPSEVQRHPEVIEAYLGSQGAA